MMTSMWQQLIRDLRDAGLTQDEIASSIGVTQPTISDLANGKIKNPSFVLGDKLKKLHARKGRKTEAKAA
jgi:predicted XRE-type DNA-binding protein